MRYIFLFFLSALSFSQQTDKVDFISMQANLTLSPIEKSIRGKVTYEFKVKKNIDTITIDAVDMKFTDVIINGNLVKFKNSGKKLELFEGFKKGKNTLCFRYSAIPRQTLYFTGDWASAYTSSGQIWTQGQGKYTSHWLPSFDNPNEKVIFNLAIQFQNDFQVISNGTLHAIDNDGKVTEWKYEMDKPMSSYLVMLAIGKFDKKKGLSFSGVPLEWYYCIEDELKYEYTYKYSAAIFDFLEKEIAIKYPWKVYRQIPVRDFLYAGMENTTSTIFAQDFVVDECGFNDRNYVNVNAHELAHQWFGDMITAKSSKHHWLQEGFATYYALLAEKEVFGEDYFYYQLYKSSIQLKNAAKNDTIPIMNEKASSLSFYQKGAWALHIIRESIGQDKFQKAIKNYLRKYKFKNVETDDFLNEVKKVSVFDIVKFKKDWLEDYHFHIDETNELLKKNKFIQELFQIQSYKNKTFDEKEAYYIKVMKSNVFYALKTEIINQINNVPFSQKQELIKLAMQTNDIKVRQAVAETIDDISLLFKAQYETLLNDKSYDTKQMALVTLWKNFPDEQEQLLEVAKNWMGKNDKELKIIFLTLYQTYKNANPNIKEEYWNELVGYTSPTYESSIRQIAFENIFAINKQDELVLKNLINATTHHKWQFNSYAKNKITELLKQKDSKLLLEKLLLELNSREKIILNNLLAR